MSDDFKARGPEPMGDTARSNPYASTLDPGASASEQDLDPSISAFEVIYGVRPGLGGGEYMRKARLSDRDRTRFPPRNLDPDPTRQLARMLRRLEDRITKGGDISNELSMFKAVSAYYFDTMKLGQETEWREREASLKLELASLEADKAQKLAETTAAHEGRLEGLKLAHSAEVEAARARKDVAIAEITAAATRRTALFTLVGTVVGAVGGLLTTKLSSGSGR